jgi:N-dimethylarginine dimethylaminohydrolase
MMPPVDNRDNTEFHFVSGCHQGNVKRQGEVTAVKETLQELGLRIMDPEPGATIDGGDVLQGRDHIFVGLSR